MDPTKEFSEAADTELDAAAEQSIEPVEGQGEKSDAKAEQAVADKMREIFGRNDRKNQADELEEEGLVSPNNPDGDTPENDKETVADDEVAEDDAAATDETKTPSDEDVAKAKTLEEFDPNLKRVAKELGNWKQKDIEDFIVSNPTLARVTFSNMLDGYNRLSLQYAQGARPGQPAQQSQQAVVTPQQGSALDDLLANPEKLKALQEIAGEELTKAFIKPMLEERKAMVEDRQFIANLRRETLVREINDSFTDISKDGFDDFYGKNGEVTQEQQSNRFRVGQLADQIRAGAQLQGVDMSVNTALRRAHLAVTADQTMAQARKAVVKQVQKRSTQITTRPTARKARVAPQTRGDGAALAAVEQFWDERG